MDWYMDDSAMRRSAFGHFAANGLFLSVTVKTKMFKINFFFTTNS